MEDKQKIEVLSALVARASLMNRMGMSYGTDRNLYQTLGYPEDISIDEYQVLYKRMDIAKAIIDRPSETTWSGEILLIESSKEEETPSEKAWKELYKDMNLRNVFQRLDKLTCLSQYGVLLMGLSDVKQLSDFEKPINPKGIELLYVKPFDSIDAQVLTYENNTKNKRYGKPLFYQIIFGNPGTTNTVTVKVHYTRVLHVVYDSLKDDVVGIPLLESVYNRLKDLEKLVGGSAEMFWRGARPGYQGKVDPEYQMTPDMETALKDQIDEYEHNLRRIIVNEGLSMEALEQQVADPSSHVDIQIQMISAVTGIPKRILTGSERGELSSAQDQAQWYGLINERRETFAETNILIPFIDICIELKFIPKPSDGFSIEWQDIFTTSDKAKADVGHVRAMALTQYASQPLAEAIVPPEAFFEFFLGLTTEQIQLIGKMRENNVGSELAEIRRVLQEGMPNEDNNKIPQKETTVKPKIKEGQPKLSRRN